MLKFPVHLRVIGIVMESHAVFTGHGAFYDKLGDGSQVSPTGSVGLARWPVIFRPGGRYPSELRQVLKDAADAVADHPDYHLNHGAFFLNGVDLSDYLPVPGSQYVPPKFQGW